MRTSPEKSPLLEAAHPPRSDKRRASSNRPKRRSSNARTLSFERLDVREMLSGESIVQGVLETPSPGGEIAATSFDELSSEIDRLRKSIGSMPSETQLASEISTTESQITSLNRELEVLLSSPVLPIDAPSWSTTGAPAGSLGKIRFDASGNDYAARQSNDGKLLILASQESNVKLVDAKTGTTLPLGFGGHGKLVVDAAFSPDGSVVATACYDGNARIFDAKSGALLRSFPYPSSLITGVTFSPSGHYLVLGRCERAGILIDTSTWQVVRELPGFFTGSPGFSPDESAVSYLDDATIRTVNLKTGATSAFNGGVGSMYAYTANRAGTMGIGGSADGRFTVYDLLSGKAVSQIQGNGPVLSVALSKNNEIVAGWPGKIVIFDASNAAKGSLTKLQEYVIPSVPTSIAISGSGRTFSVIVNRAHPQDSDIVVFPLPAFAGGSPLRSAEEISAAKSAATARQDQLISTQQERTASVTRLSALEQQRSAMGSNAASTTITQNETNENAEKTNDAFDTLGTGKEAGAVLAEFAAAGRVYSMSRNPDGTSMVLTEWWGATEFMDIRSGAVLPPVAEGLRPWDKHVMASAFAGDVLLLGGYSREIIGFDTATHAERFRIPTSNYTLDLGVDDPLNPSCVLARVSEAPLKRIDMKTGLSWDAFGDTGVVTSFAISPDGNLVALSSSLKGLALYDAVTEKIIGTLPENEGKTSTIAFSPSGSMIATGTPSGTITLWNTSTKSIAAHGNTWSGEAKDIHFLDPTTIITVTGTEARLWAIQGDGTLKDLGVLASLGGASHTSMLSANKRALIIADDGQLRVVATGINPPEADPDAIRPSMSVLSIDGPSITVAVSSPSPVNTVGIEGTGFLGNDTVEGDDGVIFKAVTLTMEPGHPSGTYPLSLRTGKGVLLMEAEIWWDAESKTLSSNLPAFAVEREISQDSLQSMAVDAAMAELDDEAAIILRAEEAIEQQTIASRLALGVITSSVLDNPVGKAIVAGQRGELMRLAASCGHEYRLPSESLWRQFLLASPTWREENRLATMRANNFSEEYFYYARGAEYEGYNRYTGAFEDAAQRMLEAGMNAVLAMRNGHDPAAALASLANIPKDPVYGTAFDWLARIRVKLPSSNDILDTCRDILASHADDLVATQWTTRDRIAYEENKMNSPTYAGASPAPHPTVDSRIQSERSAFLNRLVAAQSRLPMYAADGITIIGMGGELFRKGSKRSDLNDLPASSAELVGSMGTGDTIVSSEISYDIGDVLRESAPSSLSTRMLAGGSALVHFTLTEPGMVNLWVDTGDIPAIHMPLSQALVRPNICLSLSGTALPSPYTSEKTSSSTAGESISSVLPAGEYTLTVTDMTSYEGISSDALDSLAFPDINVGINIKPWRTQRIEGRISIDDRGETMPVRLSKIELDSEKHRRPGDALDTLNPKKPVWVIVHGWHSSEESDGIDELAMSLTAMGYQVTTLDWRNAADSITLSGADWTPAVGKWAAKQLRAAGFEGSGINVVGHSWGSYVGYFIGKTIRDGDDKGIKGNGIGIGSIVALDSAADGILTNRLDSTEVNFRDISEMSWAIESSPVGSDARALSADYSFTIASNMARMNPDFRAHSFAVTAFSSLIQDATVRRELGEETMFSPAHLLRKEAPQFRSAMNELLVPAQDELPALTMEKAYWGSGWEGVITIEPWDSIDGQGNTSHNVFPVSVEFKDRSGQTRLEMLSPIRTDTTLQ